MNEIFLINTIEPEPPNLSWDGAYGTECVSGQTLISRNLVALTETVGGPVKGELSQNNIRGAPHLPTYLRLTLSF